MRLAFVCRYFPPDAAPTGVAVAEIGAVLKQLLPSLEIIVITTDGYYAETPALAEAKIPASRLRAFPRTSRPLPRLIFALIEGRRLVRRALACSDIVVTISDPPLCELWMTRREEGQYWIHWPMDLYPEVFGAAGLVKPGSWLLRLLTGLLRRRSPDLTLAISAFQRQVLAKREVNGDVMILPCGVRKKPAVPATLHANNAEQLTFVCCGNAGQGFASAFLVQFAARLDPARHRLLVSLRGTQAPEIRQRLLARSSAVEWHEWLPEETLASASAHIVAQLPSWAGISVPSRAVTALTLARPLIAAGAEGSDLDRWGRQAGCFLALSEDGHADEAALDAALAALTPSTLSVAVSKANTIGESLRQQRQESIEALARWIAVRAGVLLENPVVDGAGQGRVTPDGLDIGHKPTRTAEAEEITR
jgi:hypothetical protein